MNLLANRLAFHHSHLGTLCTYDINQGWLTLFKALNSLTSAYDPKGSTFNNH